MKLSDKLGVGTVQFGLEYGINNDMGIPSDEEIGNILTYYNDSCEDPIIDTAISYGNSQERLGTAFSNQAIQKHKIVSKFSPGVKSAQEIRKELHACLKALKVESLYGFLAHNADTLINNSVLLEALWSAKKEGLVNKIGVSVYFPSQVHYFIENNLPIDLIQAPFNVFDRRFSETFDIAKSKGIEVHTRSAFMQGLIFKPQSFFNGYFSPFLNGKKRLDDLAEKHSLSVNGIALAFCLIQKNIDRVIIGVDNKQNLAQNFLAIASFESSGLKDILSTTISELGTIPEDVLLPYNWPK